LGAIRTEKHSVDPSAPTPTDRARAIEWRSAKILLIVAAASVFWQNWLFSAGLILGGAVTLLSFHWLLLIMAKVLLERKTWHGFQIPLKFIVVVLAVFFILTETPVSGIAFLAGTMSLVLGIFLEAVPRGSRA
jgi:hypothetical protein